MKYFKISFCSMLLLVNFVVFGQSGSIDTTFANQGYLSKNFWGNYINAYCSVVQADGKILVAGAILRTSNLTDMIVARFMIDGALDSTFADTGKIIIDVGGYSDGAKAMTLTFDGKILIGGYANDAGNVPNYALLKLSANGKLDSTFGTNGKQILSSGSSINAMGIQSTGKIIIGGNTNVMRLSFAGSIDPSFGTSGIAGVSGARELVVLNDDKIIVTGGNAMKTSKLTIDGALDLSFAVNGVFERSSSATCSSPIRMEYEAQRICVDGSGNIYIGGLYTPITGSSGCVLGSYSSPVIVKLNSLGVPVPGYGTNGWIFIDSNAPAQNRGYTNISLNLQLSTNKLLVSSRLTYPLSVALGNSACVFRLLSTGAMDLIFNNSGKKSFIANGIGTDLSWDLCNSVIQKDSMIIVGGGFGGAITMARLHAGETLIKPIAGFIGPSAVLVDVKSDFNNASSYAYRKIWRFNPNTITYMNSTDSSSADIDVAFNQPGTYTVSLTVFNMLNTDSSTSVKSVQVGSKPVSKFGVNATVGDTGSSFNFLDSSTNNPLTWEWTFTPNSVLYQNGTTSGSQNPVVKFTTQGVYTVKLKITNSFGKDSITKGGLVIITKSPAPNFTSLRYGDTNTIFNFLDATVSSSPLTHQWSFYPNNISFLNSTDSSSQNPIVKFGTHGSYSVKLKVKNINGEDSITKTNWIEIGHKPLCLFNSDQYFGTTVSQFNLRDSSQYAPVVRKWSFSPFNVVYLNGTNDSSESPIISFTQTGIYSVKLIVSNIYGIDSLIKSSFFQIGLPPSVGFEISSTIGSTSKEFSLFDSSSNNPISWAWSFSPSTVVFLKGTSSVSKNPVVSFTNTGTYGVKLVVTNVYGVDSVVKSNSIEIGSSPIANYFLRDTVGSINTIFSLYDSSLNNPTSRFWSFVPATVSYHNGTSETSPNPQISFNAPGTYQVKLVVENVYGKDSITKSNVITITTGNQNIKVSEDISIFPYPNPTNGEVFIHNIFPATELVFVTIYDVAGEVVFRKTLFPNPTKDVLLLLSSNHSLSTGIYHVTIQQQGSFYKGKLSIFR